ncbi:MAG: GYDIA family GHMP kinase [Breznakibacter sp.]
MMQPLSFYANGKLLISGEYLVLHGAKALAVPLKQGQCMEVAQGEAGCFTWTSLYLGHEWFSAKFGPRLDVLTTSTPKRAGIIAQILHTALAMANHQPEKLLGVHVIHTLGFAPSWGWGSSSTLIANLSQWLNIDAFELSRRTLGGSGYDVACARATGPLFYRLDNEKPMIEPTSFHPPFADHLCFVFLGQKQDSRHAVAHFDRKGSPAQTIIDHVSQLSLQMGQCQQLQEFMELMEKHEAVVSAQIGITPVKDRFFGDFNGAVKSLGAWGGDFVMAASELAPEETLRYFSTKGYPTLFRFHQIVLNNA